MIVEIDDLDDPEFGKYFTSFEDSAWRLETLPVYDVGYEREGFERFLAGDSDFARKQPSSWIDKVITPAVDQGRYIGRVHVIERTTDEAGNLALGEYLRFEFKCYYERNRAAGEDIRIAWTEPGTWPRNVWGQGHDFWLFDDHTVVEMHYDENGTFRKAVVYDDAQYAARARRCQRYALRASKPFYP